MVNNQKISAVYSGGVISEKEIDEAKHIWEKGVKEQIKFLEEEEI